jgi:ABC-2 type transport system ATP-binding protein
MTDTAAQNPLVQITDLSRRYGDHWAVKNISFTLNKGEVLGFLGPNGAGKSTSMQMICGNLAPTTGQIIIDGHDLIDDPIAAKSSIGYLPENPPLYRELTVDEYLHYCARLHRIPARQLNSALDFAKSHCGLEQVGKRLIGNLSKGFQQRTGIAQAIIHQPPVVILDEPTVGLDPIQIREIRDLIKILGQDRSVILSTHILPEVQATCSRVQIIRRGELIYASSIEELNRQGHGKHLTVAFSRPPTLQQLRQQTAIEQISSLDAQRFQILCDDESFAEKLVQISVEHDWGLFELAPDNTSLEEIFVELTTDDIDDTPAEAAA